MLAAYAVLVLMAFAAMLAMSYWANAVLSASDRLPMQWGLDGKPTWTAPRLIGLAFTPTLYLLTAIAIGFLMPKSWGPESGEMLGVSGLVALSFIAGHYLHIWLARRGGWGNRG